MTAPDNPALRPANFDPSENRRRFAYAYSFDRETFRGEFDDRTAAVAAAERALPTWPAAAEAIYVGRLVRPQLPVADLGDVVLSELADRRADSGQPPVAADADARDELDARLAALVRAWLDDHGLAGTARVEEISEHALPLIAHVPDHATADDEVELMGIA